MSGRSISESWILIAAMSTEPLCEWLVGKAIVLLVLKEELAALLAADGNFFGEWLGIKVRSRNNIPKTS